MTRGPTSSVTTSSASPLLTLRLFFQPLYSTLSTLTAAFPFSDPAAAADRPRAAAAVSVVRRQDGVGNRTALAPVPARVARPESATGVGGRRLRHARRGLRACRPDRTRPVRAVPIRPARGRRVKWIATRARKAVE